MSSNEIISGVKATMPLSFSNPPALLISLGDSSNKLRYSFCNKNTELL